MEHDEHQSSDYRNLVLQLSAGFSILVGIVVLVGWAFDIPLFKGVLPGLLTMKANTALGFILLGAAMLGGRVGAPARVSFPGVAAVSLILLSAATLTESFLGFNLGIDELLCKDDVPISDYFRPGRMSPLAAISFLLLVNAKLLARSDARWARWGERLCILVPLLIAARSVVGYLYGVPILYQLGQCSSMALHTTVAFQVASVGLLVSRRELCLPPLNSSAAGSAVARRFLVWAVGVPVAIGLACLQGERLGFFSGHVGLTIFVVLMGLVLVTFLLEWIRWVNHLDGQRERATAAADDFRWASENDALTGLLNRRGFLERSRLELSRARRTGRALACIVLDIDFFKKINDTHGHSAGDEVLRQFAAILRGGGRPGDLVGRLGGEEFCLLLPDTDESGAAFLTERLRATIAARSFSVVQQQVAMTSSFGVAQLDSPQQGVESLIDNADTALRMAKQTGRNRVVTASSLQEARFPEGCGGPLAGLQAGNIMMPVTAQAALGQTVRETARSLMELNLDSVPVVDAAGKLTGLLSDQDLMIAMLDSVQANQRIADCGRHSIAVFEETAAAEEIASFFARTAVQRVAIVRQGIPVGLVSRRTLLRWLLNDSFNRRSAEPSSPPDDGDDRQWGALERSLKELAAGASRLAKICETGTHQQISAGVVCEATRIQEATESLLVNCRQWRSPTGASELLTVGAISIG